jgi:4a-hydroxytetrahydrobiopterin dehydratase
MAPTLETLAREPCRRGRDLARLDAAQADALLALLPGWARAAERIEKTFRFANYHETVAFVNAVAWEAHRADHHPDLSVHYDRCVVAYSTHDVGGLSRNDFVCAARVELLTAR